MPNLLVRARYKRLLEIASHDTVDFNQSRHRLSRNSGPVTGEIVSWEDFVAQTIQVALLERVSTPAAANPLATRARVAKSESSHPRIHVGHRAMALSIQNRQVPTAVTADARAVYAMRETSTKAIFGCFRVRSISVVGFRNF